MNRDLLAAIHAEPAPPCDAFSCSQRARCAAERLACTSFAHYVTTGQCKSPFILFPERVNTHNRAKWFGPPEPTREIFMKVQNDQWGARDAAGPDTDSIVEAAVDEASIRRDPSFWLHAGVERAEKTLERGSK